MIFKKNNWNTVYKKQSPELLRLCMRYVKDQKLAEDLLHDAFLTAIDKIETFKNIGSFNGWLKKIVLNTILQHLRQSNKLVISKDYDDNILQKVDQPESIVDKKYIIAQADFSKEEIVETLETLPEHHRIVFNLYVFEGYKHTQISKMLEISVGTSKSSLSRARKKLIELLYAKAEGQVKEEKKKRKVLAALWILPLGEGFIDKFYGKGLNSFKIIPEKSLNISGLKETALVSSGMLIHLVSVLVLASVIGFLIPAITAKAKIEKEDDKMYYSSRLLTSSNLLSEFEKVEINNEGKLVVDNDTVQKKDKIKIQKTNIEIIDKYEIKPEYIVVGQMKRDTSNKINEKKNKYACKPRTSIKSKSTVFSYYILLDDFDSTIIEREKIELSKMRENIKNPLLRICDDSTFCISYNFHLDTVEILDPNTNEMVLQIIQKSDRFCGKGWINSNRGYVNFIVQDTLQLQYVLVMTDYNKVVLIKREVDNIRYNKQIKKPTIIVKKEVKKVVNTEDERAHLSYYYPSNDVAPSIIGREKITLYTKSEKIEAPVLQIFPDSTYCFKYNRVIDTISSMDSENKTTIMTIEESEADKFCGKGWVRSNGQYANFIIQDSIRFSYRIYKRENYKVFFVKEATYNLNEKILRVGYKSSYDQEKAK